MSDDSDPFTPTDDPRPAVTLRDRIAERLYEDAMTYAGVKPKALAEAPWATMRDPLRAMWLRQADSALAVVRDYGAMSDG